MYPDTLSGRRDPAFASEFIPDPGTSAPRPALTRVLLVDDQALVIAGVARLLAGEPDIELHAVQDPSRALDRAVEIRPTVILQDLVMPGADGFSMVAAFRASPELRNTPVVVLSSTEDAAAKARAFACGANDYLIKLPEREELLARLRYHSAACIHHQERDLALLQLRRELDMARKMLLGLLPSPGCHANARFEWIFRASSYVSGDCFDYFPLDERYLCFYVADVSGHGVSAAMLAFSVQHQIRAASGMVAELLRRPGADIATAATRGVESLNAHVLEMRETSLYLTVMYGVLDYHTGELALVQAGHPPAIHFASVDDGPELIGEGSVPIGFLGEPGYAAQRLRLQPGARLYLYSDGVTDCRNPQGETFGLDRLAALLGDHGQRPVTEAGPAVHAALRAWQDGVDSFEDDLTFLAVEFMSPSCELPSFSAAASGTGISS